MTIGRTFLFFALATWNLLEGCICMPPPLCTRVGRADGVVFIGKALNPAYTDAGDFRTTQRVRFQVDRAYQGLPPGSPIVALQTAASTSCEQPFVPGTTYLVFARAEATGPTIAERVAGAIQRWWHGGVLASTNGCLGSSPVHEADEEIRFLDAWAAGKTPTMLQGDVVLSSEYERAEYSRVMAILSRATVIAIGNDGQRHVGPVDELGRFRIAGVQPGLNQVTVQHSQLPAQPYQLVAVPTGACSDSRLSLRLNPPNQSGPKK